LTEFSYGHTHGTFYTLNVDGIKREFSTGLNIVPVTRSVKTELASTGDQSFYPKEYVWSSEFGEKSVSFIDKAGMNMWTGGNQGLSFGECMSSVSSGHLTDDIVANVGDLNLCRSEENKALKPQFVPSSNSGTDLFVNSIKTGNSVLSLGGTQEVLPTSAGTIVYYSDIYCKNVAVQVNKHSWNSNTAPASPVFMDGRDNIVGHTEEILDAFSPFRNSF
jgi:hypothetical protein